MSRLDMTSALTRRYLLGLATISAFGILDGASAGAHDLSGVKLVLGDQAGGLRALLEAAKGLEGAPYSFIWANFQGAAPLFEAQRAGAVDTAPAGDLPVLAAAVGDPSLRIVATRVGTGTSLGIVVPEASAIKTVADLKGRTVHISSARGSISEYQLYGALAEAGLNRTDITVRYILPIDASVAFEQGAIEVWAVFDPYYGIAVSRGARTLRDGTGIYSGLGFITAPSVALADPAKRAAIADLIARIQRAGDWAVANPEAYADVYSQLTRVPHELASVITRRAALKTRFVTDADVDTLQRVADTAFTDGILPRGVNVRSISDTAIGVL